MISKFSKFVSLQENNKSNLLYEDLNAEVINTPPSEETKEIATDINEAFKKSFVATIYDRLRIDLTNNGYKDVDAILGSKAVNTVILKLKNIIQGDDSGWWQKFGYGALLIGGAVAIFNMVGKKLLKKILTNDVYSTLKIKQNIVIPSKSLEGISKITTVEGNLPIKNLKLTLSDDGKRVISNAPFEVDTKNGTKIFEPSQTKIEFNKAKNDMIEVKFSNNNGEYVKSSVSLPQITDELEKESHIVDRLRDIFKKSGGGEFDSVAYSKTQRVLQTITSNIKQQPFRWSFILGATVITSTFFDSSIKKYVWDVPMNTDIRRYSERLFKYGPVVESQYISELKEAISENEFYEFIKSEGLNISIGYEDILRYVVKASLENEKLLVALNISVGINVA